MSSPLLESIQSAGSESRAVTQGIRDAFVGGYAQDPATTGSDNTDVETAATAMSSSSIASDSTNDDTSAVVATLRSRPGWQSIEAYADVSVPISALASNVASTTLSLDTLALTAVTCTASQTYTSVHIGVVSDPEDQLLVGVYRVDPSTGTANQVADCGDVRSYFQLKVPAGNNPSGFGFVGAAEILSIPLPTPIVANAGDIFWVAILNPGPSGNSTPLLAGLGGNIQLAEAAFVFPTNYLGASVPSTTSLPTTINDIDTDPAPFSANPPWAALGTDTPSVRTKAVTWENWFTNYVGRYTVRYGTVSFTNPGLEHPSTNSAIVTNDTLFPSDDVALILDKSFATGGVTGSIHNRGLVVRGSTGGSFVMALLRYDNSATQTIVSIKQYTNNWNIGSSTMTSGGTTRAGATTLSGGGLWKFTAVGNTYTLWRISVANRNPVLNSSDWVSQISWVDSGGLHPVGSSNRLWGQGSMEAFTEMTAYEL